MNNADTKDDDEAEEIAFINMEEKHKKAFFEVYTDFVIKYLYTRMSKLHRKVLERAVELHTRDVPAKEAAKMAIRKYRDDFDSAKFVKHAATENDSEEETDDEDQMSDVAENKDDSSEQDEPDIFTQNSDSEA